jgi:tetratricopeptide (TPR) repeat protein
VLLADLGRYDEAERLYREALEVRLKAFGPSHSAVAETRANLAALAYARGDLAAAEALHREVLALEEARLAPDDPGVALALANLAEVLAGRGRQAEAAPLLERALAIREGRPPRGAGDELAAAGLRHALASALAAGDDEGLARAQGLLEASLAARERLLGAGHPEVGATLADLAEVLRRRGRAAEGVPLLRRALAVAETAAGPGDGRRLATLLNNLAALHYEAGAYREAEPLLARALKLEEAALGPDAPALAVTLDNHAAVLAELEREEEAEAARHRARAIRLAQAGRGG